MTWLDEFHGENAGFVAELFERYERDPNAVDPALRGEFASWEMRALDATGPTDTPGSDASVAAGAAALAEAIRFFGHLAARLDPLGSSRPGDPQLDLATHGVIEADLVRLPAAVLEGPISLTASDARDGIRRLRHVYCGTTGYEFGHVSAPEKRDWLLEAVESGRFRPPADPVDEAGLLDRLTEVSAFERFLHRAYPGKTRFSIEGLGMMIPMLDELIARAAEHGVRTVILGMAHRGRLNVLAHVLGKPYDRILAEFEGRVSVHRSAVSEGTDDGWSGDVKYHAGGQRHYQHGDQASGSEESGSESSGTVHVLMPPNPSHLEFIDPVLQGMARAANEPYRRPGPDHHDEIPTSAVLIHGDASFPGQGVVAETLNLSGLAGYRTGGTLHIIANNQLGFTTQPSQSRSTMYSSDLAKGFEIPIVHVNADDPIACLAAIRLAVAYRTRFQHDFMIDLIGYRRWGHNEGDEPSFTQPRLYATIREHPTVRERFADELVQRGVVAASDAEALLRAGLDEFQRIREQVLAHSNGHDRKKTPQVPSERLSAPVPAEMAVRPVPLDLLQTLNTALTQVPDGFNVNAKLQRNLLRRRSALTGDEPAIDWGHAESLAFAVILRDGVPIRLTGQDVVRGTFSQRHLTFYDVQTGGGHTPLQNLEGSGAFEVRNSPLSEAAAVGFEYGYAVQAPGTLVLWEAQYGDFVNGAQVIVDEFVVSGQSKWGLESGLVLLLPHGWEGQGPDHSTGRLERFLELAAENNVRIANCTTAGQYFHLLRRQAASLHVDARPLVVFTPKSLLRHPLAATRANELADGSFHPVLDDARAAQNPDRVRRLVLCSGKVWADVEGSPLSSQNTRTAMIRVEQLYPFPAEELQRLIASYQDANEIIWLQEEPRNMGAWTFVQPRLEALIGDGRTLRYLGRPERASPAEGWADEHAANQRRLVEAVWDTEGLVSHVG
jgi:2-oxoglutarate dehydrogenase E1 component